MSRSQGRAACGTLHRLYADDMSGRTVKFVTAQLATVRVAQGKWREVFYEDDMSFAGYQAVAPKAPKPAPGMTGAKAAVQMSKAATITLTETRMVAGEFGRSATAGMPEWKRERRAREAREVYRKIVALEDAIERAQEKVKLWPYPANLLGTDETGAPLFGDRAVRVYPKPPVPGRNE